MNIVSYGIVNSINSVSYDSIVSSCTSVSNGCIVSNVTRSATV